MSTKELTPVGNMTATPAPTVPTINTGDQYFDTTQQSLVVYNGTNWQCPVPSGTLSAFAGTTAPPGYLLCYGQQVSTTTYAALYAVIGTTYGSGTGTFGIPDLRGKGCFGMDNMGGTAAGLLSGIGSVGATTGSQYLYGHAHELGPACWAEISMAALSGTGTILSNRFSIGATWTANLQNTTSMTFNTASATEGTGTTLGGSTNSSYTNYYQQLPPLMIVNYLIKT
jgi:microcystin-dependent protein